jgi:hypothetical protein
MFLQIKILNAVTNPITYITNSKFKFNNYIHKHNYKFKTLLK